MARKPTCSRIVQLTTMAVARAAREMAATGSAELNRSMARDHIAAGAVLTARRGRAIL